VWAQSRSEIPYLGTTHSDYFIGPIPVTEHRADDEIRSKYEANTGHAIVRGIGEIDPLLMRVMLFAGHASFCWGETVGAALETATLLETIAHMAFNTVTFKAAAEPIPRSCSTSISRGSMGRRRTTAKRSNRSSSRYLLVICAVPLLASAS
jgi:L-ribulose-5-phosphate 4-epimerase